MIFLYSSSMVYRLRMFSPSTSAASEEFSTLDFPHLLFLCDFFMTSFHSFSIIAFSSGITVAWDERFNHTSRFPEACVSERQISRVFWTIRDSRFPKFGNQNHIRSPYFFLPKFTHESISYFPDFKGLLEEFCLTDTLCRETRQHALAFTCREN